MEEAKPGMMLSVAVTHPEKPAHELLRPGFTLTPEAIAQLRHLGIGFIYVDYPGLEDLDRYFAVHLSAARQAVYEQIKAAITDIQRTAKPVAPFADYYDSTRLLITTLLDQGRQPCYVEMLSSGLGMDAVAHATAVAQLALTLGIRMEMYLIRQRSRLPAHQAREVVNLGVGGMLHDIGKAKLPADLQDVCGIAPPKDPARMRIWESHPRLGYDLIHDDVEVTAAAAVLHHHQHYDGSGFPQTDADAPPPGGEKVHVFARIVQAADLYDRLAAATGGRRRPAVEVLHLMRTRYAGWLDPEILKTFAAVVPPFPPGSKVRLSDGTAAVVMSPNPNDPYRPAVRRLIDPAGEFGAPIPLAAAGAPSIVEMGGVAVAPMVPPQQLAA
jgi:hypothetical protein